jgi:uncharacterized OB-fold protein
MGSQVPIVDYLVIDDGAPYLTANVCEECGALYLDRRNACAKCGKTAFGRKQLADTGTLKAFTIVHRAAPTVPVPYVSAVVKLDDGGAVHTNIVNVEPDPDHVQLNMRVRMTTYTAGVDEDGIEAVAFGFEPEGSA